MGGAEERPVLFDRLALVVEHRAPGAYPALRGGANNRLPCVSPIPRVMVSGLNTVRLRKIPFALSLSKGSR